MNIIFQVSGGIGKCVMATAVCEAIKKQYPNSRLITVSGYPDVFLNSPFVDRAFAFGGFSYFYEEYIQNQKDFKVFGHDPYLQTEHLYQNEHLIKTWCKMFGIQYNGELPKIYLTERETTYFQNRFASEKPLMVIQTNGGGDANLKYSWARDIPYRNVVDVIDTFKDYYNIAHIKREDQLSFENTFAVTESFRGLVVLISLSQKRFFMDSFAQHVAAGLGMPSTVCWITNKPEVFGYHIHDNILANPFTKKPELRNSYLQAYNIGGDLIEFPYNTESDIFDSGKIIDSIKRI
jgi:hypothetical protein